MSAGKFSGSIPPTLSTVAGLSAALDGKQDELVEASQAEMEAGTEAAARLMSPQDVAQAIDALAGGGGGGGVDTDVAYVDSAGNDTTGDGTASAPWLTAQKAANEGFRVIRGGVGSFGNIALTSESAIHLRLLGVGMGKTTFGNITITAPGGGVIGNGKHMLQIGTIDFQPAPGAAGANGEGAGNPGAQGADGTAATNTEVRALRCTTVTLRGGAGGEGGIGGPGDNSEIPGGDGGAGGAAGDAAELIIEDCIYTTALSAPGAAGAGGAGADDIVTPGNGGAGGTGKNGGALTITGCIEISGHSTPLSTGGEGGAGSTPREPGTDGGENGTTSASWSTIITGTDTTDTVTASIVDGVFVAATV